VTAYTIGAASTRIITTSPSGLASLRTHVFPLLIFKSPSKADQVHTPTDSDEPVEFAAGRSDTCGKACTLTTKFEPGLEETPEL
jgi:hypothetical protein